MPRLLSLLAVLSALVATPAWAEPLRVAAAANLEPLLEAVVPAFEAAHPDQRVAVTYGASGRLYAQLTHGAPFDLFLSADTGFPRRLFEAGRTAGAPFEYAVGMLVVWTPADAPAPDPAAPLAVLTDPRIRRVALPNPRFAPYGVAARAALTRAGLWERLASRWVLGANAGQAAHFAYTGAVQAAILPRSLAQAEPLASAGHLAALLPGTYPPVRQAGVVLGGEGAERARAFADFLLGPAGRRLVAAAGYASP